MCPVKVYLNESSRLNKLLTSVKLVKISGSELIFQDEVAAEVEEAKEDTAQETPTDALVDQRNPQCLTCKVEFGDRLEQVAHYKSDFHRYNLKLRLLSKVPLSLEQFSELKGDVLSISGSDSDGDNSDGRCRQLSVSFYLGSSESEKEECKRHEQFDNRLPKFYLENGDQEIISFYKKLVYGRRSAAVHGDIVQLSMDLLSSAHYQLWTVVLFNGNHFAASVFRGEEPVVHRTFHHYVVRAKRGTAQSVNDGTKNNQAKSAGASLRRQNEANQAKLIQELLTGWKEDYLDKSTLIFLRIPGYKKSLFYGGKTPILNSKDTRIRSIPFSTRRPTFNEACRVHKELYSVTVYDKEAATELFKRKNKLNTSSNENKQQSGGATSPKATKKQQQGKKRKEKKKQEVYSTPSTTLVLQQDMSDLVMVEEEHSTEHLADFAIDPSLSLPQSNKKSKKRKKNKKTSNTVGCNTEESKVEHAEEDRQKRKEIQDKVRLFEHLNRHEAELVILLYTSCKTNDVETTRQLLTERRATTTRSGHDLTQQMAVVEEDDRLSALLSCAIDQQGNTLLHVVARSGSTELVSMLLEHGADPCVRNFDSYLPYNLSPHKTARNVFRKFRAAHPQMYDYDKAQIPSPLTEADERAIEQRQADKRREKKLKQKQREREKKEATRKAKEEEDERVRFHNMTDREKRLVALERRMQAMEAPQVSASMTTTRCERCGESLFARVPFTYFDFSFCSTQCLKQHRAANKS